MKRKLVSKKRQGHPNPARSLTSEYWFSFPEGYNYKERKTSYVKG
jgi:hypothetical protein